MAEEDGPRKRRRLLPPDHGPYVLKKVIDDIPLRSEDGPDNVFITCIEHWNDNLYIGTSASEILHLVGIPAEDESDSPTYILASRLQPSGFEAAATAPAHARGVQQILVLPGPLKACVLCNGTVSFYSLPELSPAYSSKPPTGMQWIGGLDENVGRDGQDGVVVMMATLRRIMLVRVGEKLRQVKSIEYAGCLQSSRRDTIACVADGKAYTLLEVEHQQKIPLFPISSVDTTEASAPLMTTTNEGPTARLEPSSGHGRSTSMGNLISKPVDRSPSPSKKSLHPPESLRQLRVSPDQGDEAGKPTTRPRSSTDALPIRTSSLAAKKTFVKLRPHVLSPTPNEFMLTTGTGPTDPGVGLFVNLDGDVVRGTIEFDRYPEALLVHDFTSDGRLNTGNEDRGKRVIALLDKSDVADGRRGIEIQGLSGTAATDALKSWIALPVGESEDATGGLQDCLSARRHKFNEVADLLQAIRFKSVNTRGRDADPRTRNSIQQHEQEKALFESQSSRAASPTIEYEQKRNKDERDFVQRLGKAESQAFVWCGSQLWQILQNPLLLQLEYDLLNTGILQDERYVFNSADVSRILSLLGSIRDRDPENETEFLSMTYIRQKASIVLFAHLFARLEPSGEVDSLCKLAESALHEGAVDPRVVLMLIPPLAKEVLQSPDGIWLQQGLVEVLVSVDSRVYTFEDAPFDFWLMIRHYLNTWQEKKGYASITDEQYVSNSVDAALLHVLLYLDQALPEGSGLQKSTRSKLNNVVDNWKGDFERAVILLEQYKRLFVLSRLYQSRKQAKDVLATWKRIAEGEEDGDKSLTADSVENHVRRYLTGRTDVKLVYEYGLWLAKRNPNLAVELFADDTNRVKLTPADVVTKLKKDAPGAVQQYLEYLVFGKHLTQYADDLIGYYLDSVLSVLENDESARDSLAQSYSTYRALESPKPTYLDFITANAPSQPWWQSRLRLLQLLGNGGYARSDAADKQLSYSVDIVLERLAPFSSFLVSESIILDARQGRHKEALKLLVHGLGDYDTAIRYAYFGGPTQTSSRPIDASLLPSREFQQDLFVFLFHEYMKIVDVEESVERTSHLLGKFATWFNPLQILEELPQTWTIDTVSEFLLRSIRAATSERNEAIILKALSASQNLQKQHEFILLSEKIGPKIESGQPGDGTQGQTQTITSPDDQQNAVEG